MTSLCSCPTLVHENSDVDRTFDAAISALQGRNRKVLELEEDVRIRDSWDFQYADSPIGYVVIRRSVSQDYIRRLVWN